MSIKRPSPYQLSRTLGSLLILAASSFAADGALADNKGRDDVVIATPLGATGKVALQGQLVRVVDPSAANCAPAPDFSALDAAIKSQIVHLARLDAQYHGRADIVLPEELRGQQNSEPIANALRDERNALVAGAQALDAQIGEMRQDEALGDQELEFTKAKDDAIGREISLFRAQLLQVDDLMKKGLSVTTQHLSLEQNVVQLESNRLDLKLMILKSQQNHRKFERAVQDLRTQTSNEILAEATKTQASLTDLLNQRRAASASTATAGEGSKECGQAAVSIYLIAKGPDGVLQAFPVAAPPALSNGELSPTVGAGAVSVAEVKW